MLVRCDVASFNEIDPTRNHAVSVLDRPDREYFPGAFELFAELQAQNPLIRYVSGTGDGSAHKFSDFVTRDEYHGSRIYQDL